MAGIFNPKLYLAGTSGDNFLPFNASGPYNYFVDAMGGVDTLSLGTLTLPQFSLTQNTDGTINLDSVSGASGSAASHFTLYNVETISYAIGSSGRGQIDLRTHFPNVFDTSANVLTNLDLLQSHINTIQSITLVSPLNVVTTPDFRFKGVLDCVSSTPTGIIAPLTVSAAQSFSDHGILTKIVGTYNLTVTGTSAADNLFDTVNSLANLTGGTAGQAHINLS